MPLRTYSENETLDSVQTQFQKKDFQQYQLTKYKNIADDIWYIDLPIHETGWYILSVINTNTLYIQSSSDIQQANTPLYPYTNNLIWFDKDDRVYISGLPDDTFNLGFYGAHKPDIHDWNNTRELIANVQATEDKPLNTQNLGELVAEDIIGIVETLNEIFCFAEEHSRPI